MPAQLIFNLIIFGVPARLIAKRYAQCRAGHNSGHRALAHLLAALSIRDTKASKRANFAARDMTY